jgi:hypothetical protein
MVFNGSPISYWGGVEGINPMRYLGGLLGGTWVSSLISDMGNGYFDGAHLVANFENLNPANTLWTKQYHVYANVDTEEKRYLDFEKWWGGFFLLGKREIHQIVEGLFIGNKLEMGEFEIEPGHHVDLKHNHNPIVVFASFGDNITPPQQAFNWIVKTYGTVEEIKRRNQVIVYIHHSKIGHLGIFVSAKIARKEHKEIIASFDMLGFMPPGLYEMRIEETEGSPGEYEVHYLEKTMADILSSDDGLADEDAFWVVRCVSEALDFLYRFTLSPCIRWANNDLAASIMRQLHPLRMQRYLISDLNPWMIPVNVMASTIKNEYRQPAKDTNPFLLMEKEASDFIINGLNLWRDIRDTTSELLFKTMYENPFVKMLYEMGCMPKKPKTGPEMEDLHHSDISHWLAQMDKGAFVEAVVRIIIAVMFANGAVSRGGFLSIGKLFHQHHRTKEISPQELKKIIQEQSRMVQIDAQRAIKTLPNLLALREDRQDAIDMAAQAVQRIGPLGQPEKAVLKKIRTILR